MTSITTIEIPTPVISSTSTKAFQKTIDFISGLMKNKTPYALPGDTSKDCYILPVSGGGDSSTLAILLHVLFPQINFILVFTDTKAEDPEIYTSLDKLEIFLGKKITRIIPEKGLFELVDQYNGFLPSSNARYCTKVLKLTGFSQWLEQFKGQQKWMFVGIRSDESERLAFTIDEVGTEMPYVDMGIERKDVFAILSNTIGIPKFYKRRTRSGCSVCFFQRRSELVGLYQDQPAEFRRGMKYEKISIKDITQHAEAIPLWKDSGISGNWQTLPLPESDSLKGGGRRPKTTTLDLFGKRGVFIAGEFFMDGMFSHDEFVWHQRVISYSPTLSAIRKQIDDRYRHLLGTGEVYEMTPDDVRAKVKFAIWFVELPEDIFHPDGPKDGGYTWQKNASYAQLQHIISWCTRALHAEGLRQLSNQNHKSELSFEFESKQESQLGLAKIVHEVGHVTQSQWYKPTEALPNLTLEEEVASMACPMCSI